jgi:hypothetical protein
LRVNLERSIMSKRHRGRPHQHADGYADCDAVMNDCRARARAQYLDGCKLYGSTDLVILLTDQDEAIWRSVAEAVADPDWRSHHEELADHAAANGLAVEGKVVTRERHNEVVAKSKNVLPAIPRPARLGRFYALVWVVLSEDDGLYDNAKVYELPILGRTRRKGAR